MDRENGIPSHEFVEIGKQQQEESVPSFIDEERHATQEIQPPLEKSYKERLKEAMQQERERSAPFELWYPEAREQPHESLGKLFNGLTTGERKDVMGDYSTAGYYDTDSLTSLVLNSGVVGNSLFVFSIPAGGPSEKKLEQLKATEKIEKYQSLVKDYGFDQAGYSLLANWYNRADSKLSTRVIIGPVLSDEVTETSSFIFNAPTHYLAGGEEGDIISVSHKVLDKLGDNAFLFESPEEIMEQEAAARLVYTAVSFAKDAKKIAG